MVNVRISFVTFTRNSGERLRGLLEHVKDVVDEIIVIDGCNTDDTVEIALSYGAKVYRRRPRGHVEPDRMFALSRANHDWILYLDDDERLSKHLKRDLREIIARFGTEYKVFPVYRVELCKHDIPVSASLQIRVYHKNYVLYKGLVHELPEVLGPAITLDPREYFIVHRPKYFREHFRKSGLIAYAYLESMEYPDPFRFKSPIRRTLYKLMPFSCALYLLYSVVKLFVERGGI